MAVRAASSVLQRRGWGTINFRLLSILGGTKHGTTKEDSCAVDSQITNVAIEAAGLCGSNSRWSDILLSRYKSFNFEDPRFFSEFLKHQDKALCSIMMFHWLWLRYKFVPDKSSCSKFVSAACDFGDYNAARWFLSVTGYRPDPDLLEFLVHCFCRAGRIEEAVGVFLMFKDVEACPPVTVWNLMFSLCAETKRTDLFWKLYQFMLDSDALGEIDAKTLKYMIRSLLIDRKEDHGYHLFKLALEKGLYPHRITFNELIYGFAQKGDFSTVSELLHLMIARNVLPDVYSYQHIIRGLWCNRKTTEAIRIFNEIKIRGYEINRVVYTTMISGCVACRKLETAKLLWTEMIEKGIKPDKYAYSSMAFGYFLDRKWVMGMQLFAEGLEKGFCQNTLSYSKAILGLCICYRPFKALQLFDEMKEKGIARCIKSYNCLIFSFSKLRKGTKNEILLKELVAEGLQPTVQSFRPIIQSLCRKGKMRRCKKIWDDMLTWNLEPMACDYNDLVSALSLKNLSSEAMECFTVMISNDHKPCKTTFVRLFRCLLQNNRMNEAMSILKSIYETGYTLDEGMSSYLMRKCKNNARRVQQFTSFVHKIDSD